MAMLDGAMTVVPRQRFGVADVRDVADAHIRAMAKEAPGDELPDLVIHNDRARNELGWRPRPAETTIVETAESLRAPQRIPRRSRRCIPAAETGDKGRRPGSFSPALVSQVSPRWM